MPNPVDDAMRDAPQISHRPPMQRSATLPAWLTCVAAATSLLLLAACGDRVEAGPTGGLVESGDAMSAQHEALAHCRKYGKTGRVTHTVDEETYNFVCE